MVLTLLVSAYKLCRSAMSNSKMLVTEPCQNSPEVWWTVGPGGQCQGEVSPGLSSNVQAALHRILPDLHQAISATKQATGPRDLQCGMAQILTLVEEAWVMPTVGREVAKGLCDGIRLEGGLDLLLSLLQSADLETKCQAGKLLEQILVAENR